MLVQYTKYRKMIQTMSLKYFFKKASIKLSNLLLHLTIDTHPHPAFVFTLQTIAILQLVSVIVEPSSQLKWLSFWTEPTNYLPLEYSLISGAFIVIIYILLLGLRLIQSENDYLLVKPSMCLRYLSTIIAYFRYACQTVVLIPLLVACLKEMMMPTNVVMLGISVISYILYFAIVYPISLYCSSGTSILTENKNRKISILNLELMFNIYKIVFVLSGTINQESIIAFAAIFFILFAIILVKWPFYCFKNQKINRAMVSTVAFICLIRIFNAILNQSEGYAFLEVVATTFFIFFCQQVANFRLKKILKKEQLTIYQIKCLIFMLQNMSDYIEYLIFFIFNHHKKCKNTFCKCTNVIEQVKNQAVEINSENIWYEFIISYIHGTFDMKVMEGLPATEMQIKMNKFYRVIFDVAQIYIFKLSKNNIAFLLVSQYKSILKAHNLSSLWSWRKYKIFLYYLHQKIDEKCKQQQNINHSAQKYIQFQIQFTKYVGLLLKSAKKLSDFWDEMGKKDPDQPTLLGHLKKISIWNKNICKDYSRITNLFTQSKQLINPITNDYFELVLNVDQKDSMHIIKNFDSQLSEKKKEDSIKRKDENTRIYSYDSQTALCFVSVDPTSLGKVQFTNQYFDKLIYDECGKINNISDLLLPEIRNSHFEKMQKFIRGDMPNLDHRQIVFLTRQKKIVMSQMMVQLVPCVSAGIRYAIFLKKIQPQRKIICFTERNQQQYISSSMEYLLNTETQLNLFQLKNKINLSIADIKSQIEVSWKIDDNQYTIRLINYFEAQKKSLLLIQIIDKKEEDKPCEITTQIQKGTKKATYQNSKTSEIILQNKSSKDNLQLNRMSSNYKKKSFFTSINRNSKELKHKQQQQQIAQKTQDKLKKEDKKIRKIFAAIVGIKQQRKIIRNIFFLIIIFFLLIIVMIICLIVAKKSDYYSYKSATNDFFNLNTFMMLMINTATDLQLLNLHTSIPSVNSTFLLDRIKNTPSFTDALDKIFSSFEISQIEQSWTALNIISNKTIQPLARSNIMTVYDFIQVPINNIAVNFNLTDFNFPISFDYLTTPLTNFEIHFHNFVQNALYVTIPNFFTLRTNTLRPLINQKINRGTFYILLCVFIIVAVFLFQIIIIVCRCRVAGVKHLSYRLLESLPIRMLQDKKQKGKQFCRRYSLPEGDNQQKQATIVYQPRQSDSQVLFTNVSKNFSKTFDDLTQRQLDTIRPSKPEMLRDTKQKENKPQMIAFKPKRNNNNIFKNTKYCRFILTLSVTLLPLLIFGIVLLALLQKQIYKITNTIALEDGFGWLERHLTAIKLYSIHNGVYSLEFQQYKNMSTTLSMHLNIMFMTLQFIMTEFQGTYAPETLSFLKAASGNLCSLEQQGLFRPSNYSFPGRGNLIECQSLSNGILKQGYIASVLHFLQNANRNYLSNPTAYLYNQTQKISYLNSYFLTNTSLLIDYFILVSETSFHYTKIDLQNTVSWHLNLIIIWGSLYIVVSVIMVTLCRNIFLNFFRDDVAEISTVMTTISCKTVIQNQQLKKEFINNLQTYKIVK